MRTIWRYEVLVNDKPNEVRLLIGSNPLRVEHDSGSLYGVRPANPPKVHFWAEVYTETHTEASLIENTEIRHFQVFGTGHEVPENAVYYGTTAREMGLVWHLFEVFPDKES